jgi:hypothetical protein
MPKNPCRFTQAELARAMRVAVTQGMTVEVRPDGSIRIIPVELTKGKVDYRGEIRL